WRPRRRSGGQEAEAARTDQAGAVHHALAADRVLRRPALPHREAGIRRENEDLGAPVESRRTHARDCPYDERGEADGHLAEARRADAESEPVASSQSTSGSRINLLWRRDCFRADQDPRSASGAYFGRRRRVTSCRTLNSTLSNFRLADYPGMIGKGYADLRDLPL